MLGTIGIATLILGFAIVVWHVVRARRAAPRPDYRRAVVAGDDMNGALYPYVFVSDRGSVRELHASERELLETPFHPLDSARPHIKVSYEAKNARGSLSGYCPRSAIPRRVRIGYPPIDWPARTPHPAPSRLTRGNGAAPLTPPSP